MYEDGWLSVVEHRVRDAADRESAYGVVHFRKVGLRILPVDEEGHTYLVGQYRFGAGYYSWELPAGGSEKGEVPLDGAARELREEVGRDADYWLELPHLIPSGSVTDERQLLFLAWGLTGTRRDPDPQEALRIRRIPVGEALRMALSGQIADAGTVAILTIAHLKAVRREIPDDVARLLQGEA
jgi:8-oxo-dGTP pyrophosphatase MutT (NUDIX family)